MTSLSSARVAETLAKLHADADAADRDFTVKMVTRLGRPAKQCKKPSAS